MRRRTALTLAVTALAGAAPAIAPSTTAAASCTPAISGPNDPNYAGAERNRLSGETFNVEEWPLYDCIPQSAPAAQDPQGRSGMAVNRAWQAFGYGSPRVIVAYMEGGVNWTLPDSRDLRLRAYLNTGELPWPEDAAGHVHGTYDLNGDGVVDVEDYAQDPRIHRPFLHAATAGGITAEDLIATFGHCQIVDHRIGPRGCPPGGMFDNDRDGYPNDVSGWNFHRDTNDPETDQTSYDHANTQSNRIVATANNGFGGVGLCPGCRLLSVKLGDEAIDRPDRVAEGIVFAVDAGAKVIDVTSATVGQTPSMQAAVDYAYRHGVVVAWASNDFESADHTEGMRLAHVWPGNSLVSDQTNRLDKSLPNDLAATTFRARSSVTSYGPHALFAVPTIDGSTSAATPTQAGVAALVTSAGLDAAAAHQIAFPLSADEVTQVVRATADPIELTPCALCFAAVPEAEFDIFYGYGRPNVYAAMAAVHAGNIPPSAMLDAPDWYHEYDPTRQRSITVRADVAARRASGYRWVLQYALGPQPADASFVTFASGASTRPQTVTGRLPLSAIPAAFWSGPYVAPTADRSSIERYDVTIRVRAIDPSGRIGEERRVVQVRHDPTELESLHLDLGTSLESSPTLADVEGRGRLDVIVAGSDGSVHVLRPDGREAPGFPVHTLPTRGLSRSYRPNYLASRIWRSGTVPLPREPITAPLAVGDLHHDGGLDIVACGDDGRVYAWDGRGRPLRGFPVATDRRYARQAVPVPSTPYLRNPSTGSFAGAALADLRGNGQLDIVMGGWDGHVYAWQPNGRPVPGWPVSTTVPAADRLPAGTQTYARDSKVATTPTIVDIDGDGRPDVVVALQDTAFGPNKMPVYGFVEAFSSRGNRRPGGALLPHFPVTLPAAAQGYGTAQDFITEGVQTPAAFDGAAGPELVANPGLSISQVINLRTGSTRPEQPSTLPAAGAREAATSIVHFTTSPSRARLPGRGVTVLQAGSALTDIATAIVATPGLGIEVRSALTGWDPQTGTSIPAFTQAIQGLAFIAAPAVADVSGDGTPDVIEGADSGALHAFDGVTGAPVPGWPKWTGGWSTFTPAVGDLSCSAPARNPASPNRAPHESSGCTGRNVVIVGTREGWLHAYRTPGLPGAADQAWHWHQNDWNTGLLGQDTRPPAAVADLRVRRLRGARVLLAFTAPGGDWNAGRAARYQLFASRRPITQSALSRARRLPSPLTPAPSGTRQHVTLTAPRGARFYAIRAIDAAGNIGPLPVRARRSRTGE